jgi:hypothetical protein
MASSTALTNLTDANASSTYPSIPDFQFPNLNLTTFPNLVASLTFDSNVTNFPIIAKSLVPLFSPDVFSFTPLCTYTISGQYGSLPRLIYYTLLVFSLVLRHHDWLSAAALGTSMTYAATASVHAIALIIRSDVPLIHRTRGTLLTSISYQHVFHDFRDSTAEVNVSTKSYDADLMASTQFWSQVVSCSHLSCTGHRHCVIKKPALSSCTGDS